MYCFRLCQLRVNANQTVFPAVFLPGYASSAMWHCITIVFLFSLFKLYCAYLFILKRGDGNFVMGVFAFHFYLAGERLWSACSAQLYPLCGCVKGKCFHVNLELLYPEFRMTVCRQTSTFFQFLRWRLLVRSEARERRFCVSVCWWLSAIQ